MTALELEQLRAQVLEEAREVLQAAVAQRFAGDFDAAVKLTTAGRRLLGMAGASDAALLFLVEDVLEDEQRSRGAT